jgi:hypothetical protein
MIRKIFTLATIVLIVLSCTSPKKLVNDKNAERLYFGNFGGFTNASLDYLLINNRMVYKIEQNNPVFVKKLTSKASTNLQDQIRNLNLSQYSLNEPGNITYYIKSVKDGIEKEIKFSSNSSDDKIKELYKTLMSTVKQ